MLGVLEGFGIIGFVIAVGYVVGRMGLLGDGADQVLNRTVFFVATPCLLFTVISAASPSELFSPTILVAGIAAVVAAAVYVVVARLVWRRPLDQLVVGALASGYVNSNNIGLPVGVYVLGTAAYTAPLILLQLVVFTPAALVLLEHAGSRRGPRPADPERRVVVRTVVSCLRNPLLVASLLGLAVSVSGLHPPAPVLEPLRILGGAAVPLMLMVFGMSIHGARFLAPGSGRKSVALATGCKLLLMPAAAWLVATAGFGLDGQQLRAVVVLAALPTAQNVMNYAFRYGTAETATRDTVLLTTLGAVPVLVLVSLLTA